VVTNPPQGIDRKEQYYYKAVTGNSLNIQYRDIDEDDDYKDVFSPNFRNKLKLIKQVVDSFNYNDSNAMVDYFNRGFYEDYYLKNVA